MSMCCDPTLKTIALKTIALKTIVIALQINQAMKYGVPVVATPLAVEGMHLKDEQECLIADNPQTFATKVLQLYTDCKLWIKLVIAAYSSVERHFSVEVVGGQLLKTLEFVHLTALPSTNSC
jgi:glycosyltransferase involved in cell wall biosynthesis